MLEKLEAIKSSGLWRELKNIELSGDKICVNGTWLLNFASNDYLGISSRLDLQREFFSKLDTQKNFLLGSTSSRLLSGNFSAYSQAEELIGSFYNSEILMFNGGYHANTGILPAIADEGDCIIADKLVHASIIDSLSLCKAKWLRFAHNDYEHLRKLLSQNRANFKRVFIVTEGAFSMDGDRADLPELVKIKKEFDCLLYVDEAHSFGVFGRNGLGLCEEMGVLQEVDFIMCTLGKALGSSGAFVVCKKEWKALLINCARSFIFTTALPPVSVLWTSFIFEKMTQMTRERAHLKNISNKLRAKLQAYECLGDTQILPVVIGKSEDATSLSKTLFEGGVFAPAIRYPTVPKNGARIRLSLTANMSEESVEKCAQVLLNAH